MEELIKFLGQSADGVLTIIAGGITILVSYGLNYVIKKWKLEAYRKYGEMAEHWIETVVLSIKQQYTDELKKATADGKLTEEEKQKLKNMAIEIVMQQLPTHIQKALNYLFGDIKTYVAHRIEAFLAKWRVNKS